MTRSHSSSTVMARSRIEDEEMVLEDQHSSLVRYLLDLSDSSCSKFAPVEDLDHDGEPGVARRRHDWTIIWILEC